MGIKKIAFANDTVTVMNVSTYEMLAFSTLPVTLQREECFFESLLQCYAQT